MLEAISWSEYTEYMAVGLAVWYGGLAATCYRPEIAGLLKGVKRRNDPGDTDTRPTATTYWTPTEVVPEPKPSAKGTVENSEDDRVENDDEREAFSRIPAGSQATTGGASAISELHEFVDCAQQAMLSVGSHAERGLLKQLLMELLKQYPRLLAEPERTTVKNFLLRESRLICNIIWDMKELETFFLVSGSNQ